MTSMKIYGWSNGEGGTHWYRIAEPLRGLGDLGHQWGTGPEMTDWVLDNHDTIITHMLNEERGSEAWEKIARRNQHRLIIDVDDDVWNFDPRTDSHRAWSDDRLLRLQNNIACADLVTTPSDHLADILSELNPNVAVLPNCVPAWLLKVRPFVPRRFTMGYQGARQHAVDLQDIAMDIHAMFSRHEKARLHIWGELDPVGWNRRQIMRTSWNADVPSYYRSLAMSVGLGPLADIPFNYAKSAIRAVEYAALGIPAMLTDVPAYRPYVSSETGWLIPMGDRWIDRLEWAYENRGEIAVMGQRARIAARNWTTEANAKKWEDAYRG